MKLFVVSTNPIAGGRFVDTERFPKLEFIAESPSLAIPNLKNLTLQEQSIPGRGNENRTAWAFRLELAPEDAPGLKTVTTSNVLKRFLITIGDEPVFAATINGPLGIGVLEIKCEQRARMEFLKEKLATVKRVGQ